MVLSSTGCIAVSIKGVSGVEAFSRHITSTLPSHFIESCHLNKAKGKRVNGIVSLRSSADIKNCARLLRASTCEGKTVHAQADNNVLAAAAAACDDELAKKIAKGKITWKDARTLANEFFGWIYASRDYIQNKTNSSFDPTSVDRDEVSRLFELFMSQNHPQAKPKQRRRLESFVLSAMRSQKLVRTKRYNNTVVCSFAREDKTSATSNERRTATDRLLQQQQALYSNKGGIEIPNVPVVDPGIAVLPINTTCRVTFPIAISGNRRTPRIELVSVRVAGPQKRYFDLQTPIRSRISATSSLNVSFLSPRNGVYRATFTMTFRDLNQNTSFKIARRVLLRSGDADMYDILKPTSPYIKKRRKYNKPAPAKTLGPPKEKGKKPSYNPMKKLNYYNPPKYVRDLVKDRKMECALVPPTGDALALEFNQVYTSFWQQMLWASEIQAYQDIQLFDMENARLAKTGYLFVLHVDGLAEGRPSVLRGDTVLCNWKKTQYQGRVVGVELLDVLIEFHPKFHTSFNINIDTVDLIRFTFSRSNFRTSHEGVLRAPESMGRAMLTPTEENVAELRSEQGIPPHRPIPNKLPWANRTLNPEQKMAARQIASGLSRPMPYVIFGPPGTGKTTTLIEAVYQLAHIHRHPGNKKLNLLLVAPSNDAADNLVEKLEPYFPPSEMMRVLAYSRPKNQVPAIVQKYVREGVLDSKGGLTSAVRSVQIVVSTVNLAARFWCHDVPEGLFDVLCVDEAGHATEPEVIAVSSTLFNWGHTTNPGQLILAGDPRQLGPIITSPLCKKFGMAVSYMERLLNGSPVYFEGEDGEYPPELVTLLKHNYRSHEAILKLPNEMFYENQLIACGDRFTTHSLCRWEHLPRKGFPVLFHAVEGENLREGISPSWYNPQEIQEVVKYVELLVKYSRPAVNPNDIGIITPYARQVQKLRLALKAKDMGDVKVGSVETFQGQERRCIILTTVRAETEYLQHDLKYNLGFVANEKRFNVAITRAQALLIVVGHPRVLATDPEHWLPFLIYCRNNESWAGACWDETEDIVDDNGAAIDGSISSDSDNEEEHPSRAVEQEGIGFINREE